MSKEAFEALCKRRQMIEELPLEKREERLRQKIHVIEDMLRVNEENPEKLKRQILETLRDIETTLHYLQTITHSTNPAPGFPLDFDL
jgi:hypothetical protein